MKSGTTKVLSKSSPFRLFVEIICVKWVPAVIYSLSDGPKRHGEIKKIIPGISTKMLVQTLRRLQISGVIAREVKNQVPPNVEYQLTEVGKLFVGPLKQLCDFATANSAQLTKIQRKM